MALAPVGRLFTMGTDLLDAIEKQFVAAGITLPTRRYVHTGDIAHDCDQLVVSLTRLFRGLPGLEQPADPGHGAVDYRTVVWTVELIRCTDQPNRTPTAAELQAEASARIEDLWTLHHGVWLAQKAAVELPSCSTVLVGDVEAIGPQGGPAGWRMTVEYGVL